MKRPDRHKISLIDDYLEISFDQFTITGRSVAGIETVFSIPQFNLTLDIGKSPSFVFSNDYLALTHCHIDHAGGVAFNLGVRHLNSLGPQKIILPDKKLKPIMEYLKSLKNLSETSIDYQLFPASQPVKIKKNLILTAIPSDHCTTSTGYGITALKKRLNPEFKGLDYKEVVAKKEKGAIVDKEVSELLLAYSGDTTSKFFETEAVNAQVLIMECSFFGDGSERKKTKEFGHTHINDWSRYAHQIKSHTVIMSHTSRRYSIQEIEQACKKKLPADLLDRLILFR